MPARPPRRRLTRLLRAKAGFDIIQMVSEYRALRASVLREWLRSPDVRDETAIGDIVRFNEAVDQAVAESVSNFTAEAERWRNVFLAVLGHDLRGPLNAVLLTAEVLSTLGTDTRTSAVAERLMKSGKRMRELLDSLLDYSRSSLGQGIVISRQARDLATDCAEEIETLRESLPGRELRLSVAGDMSGLFDGSRVREASATSSPTRRSTALQTVLFESPWSAARKVCVCRSRMKGQRSQPMFCQRFSNHCDEERWCQPTCRHGGPISVSASS
jgi:signal transduction histidine kinase